MSKMSKAIAVLGVVAGLGVAALPLSSYAAPGEIPDGSYTQSTSAQVQTKVDGAISISSNIETVGTDGVIDLGNLMPGSSTDDMADGDALVVTVKSNTEASYSLYINGLNGETAMIGQATGAKIPTGTTLDGTVSAWGYSAKVGEATTFGAYQAIPANATKVDTHTKTDSTDPMSVDASFKFKAAASTSQTPDTYVGTVVFTAALEN